MASPNINMTFSNMNMDHYCYSFQRSLRDVNPFDCSEIKAYSSLNEQQLGLIRSAFHNLNLQNHYLSRAIGRYGQAELELVPEEELETNPGYASYFQTLRAWEAAKRQLDMIQQAYGVFSIK